jgi:hypothetical protein
VGTILNQQVTQTMAFVVAGFCKVFVGEMVEKGKQSLLYCYPLAIDAFFFSLDKARKTRSSLK